MQWSDVWNWLWQLLKIGGPLALLGVAAFKKLGTKWTEEWINTRFARQLEALKHEHDKELENVRHAIQSMFSRISKIHEKEFDVLPTAWFMLHDAHGTTANALDLRMTYPPDLKGFSDDKLEAFLAESGLHETLQDDIRAATDRDKRYSEILVRKNYADAKEKHRLLNNYIIQNRIFLTKNLDVLFTDASKVLIEAVEFHRIGARSQQWKMQEDAFEKFKQLDQMLPTIQRAIQERLCYEAAGQTS
jgi:hypothetical protein